MNDFEYDVLTRVAYGEAEPGDRAELERLVEEFPEAVEYLEQCTGLKGEMALLAQVPECRVTAVQLKKAIADNQRASRTKVPSWGYGLVGAAAALVAFAYFKVPRQVHTVLPQTASQTDYVKPPPDKAPELTQQELGPLQPGMPVDPNAAAPDGTFPPSTSSDPLFMLNKPSTGFVINAPSMQGVIPGPPVVTPAPTLAATPTSPELAMAAKTALPDTGAETVDLPASVSVSPNDPVVVVSQILDPETGAPSAIEVKTSDGVEFSG